MDGHQVNRVSVESVIQLLKRLQQSPGKSNKNLLNLKALYLSSLCFINSALLSRFLLLSLNSSKKIASADGNGNVYLRDLQDSQPRKLFDGNRTSIKHLAFSADGSILIASGANESLESDELQPVKFWDLQQDKSINPFGSYSSNVIAAAFNSDGKLIVSGGKDGTLQLWDLQGNLIDQSPTIKSDNAQILAVAFSADGKLIVSAGKDGYVRLWKLQGRKILGSSTLIGTCNSAYRPLSVTISSNNQQIICNLIPDYSESGLGLESFVTLWNWDSLENKWKQLALKGGNSSFLSKVLFASFSPDSSTIITGDQDGSIRLWNSEGKEIGQSLLGHGSNVESVAFSSDGKKIISGSQDGSIRLWDVEQNLFEEQSFSSQGTDLILSPDGQKVAIGGKKNDNQRTVTLLDITGNQIGQILSEPKIKAESNSEYENGEPLTVSSKGYVVFDDESGPTLWHPGSTLEKQSIGSPNINIGREVVISPDSSRIVSSVSDEGDSTSIQLWDIQGNPIGQPMKNERYFSVESIAFSPNGQQIVSGSHNNSLDGAPSQSSVCLFKLKVDGLDKKLCQFIPGGLMSVAFSPNSKIVAIGQTDGGLYLWNLDTNQIGQRFGGNEHPVLSIAFSPDGKTIASGNRDGSVRLWNLDGTPIGRAFQNYTNPNKAVSSIAFNRDGKTVIVAYRDGTVRFWQTTLEPFLQVACDRLRYHPVLKDINIEAAKGAKETCEKYVWNFPK